MSRRKNIRTAKKAVLRRLGDGVNNPLLRVGTGSAFSATTYVPQFTSMKRQELEWAYQGSWICGLAVDIVAEDMCREGIEIKHDDPDVIDRINGEMDDLAVWDSLCDAIKWSRLYGGAIAVMLIDGDDMSQPLGKIKQGAFKGLLVFDRWQLDQADESYVQTLGPDFGMPEYYRVTADRTNVTLTTDKIHHSRVIRLEGRRLPFYLRQAYQGWGASVLEPLYEQVKMFDMGTRGIAQLLSKCYLRYYKVEGLRDILTNDLAREGFLAQMDIMRQFQGIEGLTIGDTTDDFQTLQYTFTGIPEVLLQIGQQVSGAIGIPLVRLFGQSPVGFNSTGESDLRIYYDNVKHEQDTDLRSGMKRLLNVIFQSVTGTEPGKDFGFEFKPLWQMSEEQKATVSTALVGSIVQSYQADVIPLSVALTELRQLSDTVGMFASITDDDINTAKEMDEGMMPPDASEVLNASNEEDLSGADTNVEAGRVVPEETAPSSEASELDS